MRCRNSLAATAFVLLASVLVVPAHAQQLEPQVPPDLRQILPPDSCALNPGVGACPAVDGFVIADDSQPDSTAYAPLPAEASRASRPATARASQVQYACAVQSFEPVKLTHPDGDAFIRGTGVNTCKTASHQELYVTLSRWRNDAWQQLDTGKAMKEGPGEIQAKAGFNCHHQRVLAYRTEALAYAVVKNIGYLGGPDYAYKNHTCWP